MRENMIYNPGIYQLREPTLKRMLAIIDQQKTAQPNGILFYGDSITEFWPLDRYYPGKNIYNSGIAGATVAELTWFVDEGVIKFRPNTVVLMVGINDLGNTAMNSPREIAVQLNTLAHLITENLPECKLYIIAPLPCDEAEQDYYHVGGIRCNYFVRNIYDLLKELVTAKNTTIINAYPLFIINNKCDTSLYVDGLHLNEKGYKKLSQILLKQINVLE